MCVAPTVGQASSLSLGRTGKMPVLRSQAVGCKRDDPGEQTECRSEAKKRRGAGPVYKTRAGRDLRRRWRAGSARPALRTLRIDALLRQRVVLRQRRAAPGGMSLQNGDWLPANSRSHGKRRPRRGACPHLVGRFQLVSQATAKPASRSQSATSAGDRWSQTGNCSPARRPPASSYPPGAVQLPALICVMQRVAR